MRKDFKGLNLLYRATRDSGNSWDFHRKVYNKKPLLMLIKTDKFGTLGVYTSKPTKYSLF